MIVSDALKNRKSVRAYLDKEVTKAQIEKILNLAKHAPFRSQYLPLESVDIPKDTILLLGMVFGYEDTRAVTNGRLRNICAFS